MQRQKAIAEPGYRENDENCEAAECLCSSLSHRKRLVRAVVTDSRARAMTLRCGLGRSVAFARRRPALARFGRLGGRRDARGIGKIGTRYAEHRLLRRSLAPRPRGRERCRGRRRCGSRRRRPGGGRRRRRRHSEDRVFTDALRRRRSIGLCVGVRFLVHTDTGLV